MNTGHYISGAGHALLIGWLVLGGSFAPAPEPFKVSEVSVITGEEFAAMMAAQQAPDTATDVTEPTPPESEAEPPAMSAAIDAPPEASQPEATTTTQPDAAPDVSQVTPPSVAEVSDTPPEMSAPSEDVAALVPEISARPQPRPAPRVAPEPVARPEQDVKIDDSVKEAATPEPEAATPREETVETAPEEATTEIVTEATEKPSAAPPSSKRPRPRPAAPQVAAKPEPAPAAKPKPDAPARKDAVQDALAEALGGTSSPTNTPSAAPSGPPMTGSEKEALRVAVSSCWNVGSLSSDALRTTVVVLVDMAPDGTPLSGSIRMASYSGGSAGAAEQAFSAARRAILRCQKDGYNLPSEKYDHWRQIEMTFNPEKMRVK